jgi:hypothetical protein
VREAEVVGVRDELVGELLPPKAQPPRLGMHFVDGERPLEPVGHVTAFQPAVISPLVARPIDPRGGLRRHLRVEGERIGLQTQLTVGAVDLELVAVALGRLRHDRGPDPGGAERLERVDAAVPPVPIADDGDSACVRSPDGERDTLVEHVRAQALVDPLVPPLARQVQVELAQLHWSASSIRRIPATGIETQSGRLASS